MTDWEIHGMEFGNCNCAYGCPCQFNALPTQGHCRAIGFFRIDRGHFGETPLDGLNMAIAVIWPGAVHRGHGTLQPIIDRRADDAQGRALLSILTGQETDEMATFLPVYPPMCDTVPAHVRPGIRLVLDIAARPAPSAAPGVPTGRPPTAWPPG